MDKTTAATTGIAFLKNLLYIPAAFLMGVDQTSYEILGLFMVLDLVLGVTHAGIVGGVKAIRSQRLIAGVISKLTVMAVPLIVVWAGRGAGIDLLFLAQWSVGILVLAQAYSVLGHINSIRMGRDEAEGDIISYLMQSMRVVAEQFLMQAHPTPKERRDEEKDNV